MSASGGDFKKSWEFHKAPCSDIDVANTLIHLPINTVSTLVLASSNFFIQILNSPSRTAVDKIHTKGQWLDIGILSLRNAFHLSRWKLCVCLGLFLTSIPIHIFFNSSIFVIDTRMGDFNIVIAAEAFVNGGAFNVPGASVSTKKWRNRGISSSVSVNQTIGDDTMVTARNFPDAIPNISAIAAEASGWQRLDKVACRNVYADEHCEGLREFRNVVMVTGGVGWNTSYSNRSQYAQKPRSEIMPPREVNTLWSSTQCNMLGHTKGGKPFCHTDCTGIVRLLEDWPNSVATVIERKPQCQSSVPTHHPLCRYNVTDDSVDFLQPSAMCSPAAILTKRAIPNTVEVSYCLAEPRPNHCSLAFSQLLFMVSILSILMKLLMCIVILLALGPEEPLVLLGTLLLRSYLCKEAQHWSWDY
ncbi:hypothetical protein CGCF415_v009850 [Colletotrichum fructicola]|nr:hypothetical protein CGCFRS4_v009272 [Colletotrichum fructicola]KAF4901201.1 hypothetical protein CGCF415_v009850 [Colletotrichum fructicola]KAF4931308.1 hypothetical protein CGCF245_v011229 [Colletotrichum fructicola]